MAKHDPKQFSEPAPGPRMGDVGLMLRTAREERRLDLREVADRLRIRHTFLSAIEEGRYGDLPGATYAVGFVRAYAEAMGLDGDEIVRRFKEESAIVPKNADLDFPTPVNEGGLPSGAIILLALILAGAVYGVWYWSTTTDRPIAEMIQDVPDRFVAMIKRDGAEDQTAPAPEATAPATTPATEDAAPAATPAAPAEPVTAEAPPPADAADVEPPRAETDTAAEAPAPQTATAPANDAPERAATQTAPAAVGDEPVSRPAAKPAPAPVPTPVPAPVPSDEAPRTAPVERTAEPTTSTATTATPGTPAPAAPVTPAPATPAPAAPAAQTPATAPPATATPAAPPAPDLAAAPSDVPTDGRVFGSENANARIVLHARADSWVQVRSPEGLLLTRLLKRGDSYRVPANRADLELMVGNAGGLVIEVDGRTLPPMGRTGEVLRGIPLDVERLKAGVANAG